MKKLHNEKLKQQFIQSSGYLEQFSFDVSLDTHYFSFPPTAISSRRISRRLICFFW